MLTLIVDLESRKKYPKEPSDAGASAALPGFAGAALPEEPSEEEDDPEEELRGGFGAMAPPAPAEGGD